MRHRLDPVLCFGALAVALLSGPVGVAPAAGVQIISEQRTAPRVVLLTISTPAFTIPTKVDVDLPVGYDADPHRRWPVTYILAGTMNTYATFNGFVNGVKLAEPLPSLVVSPNGDSGYWSDWYNGGAFGPPMYETYVIDQLIPLIDAHFRTIADRAHRAVTGVSMGGSGSMMLAAEHPDLFAAAGSISGAVDSNLPANGAVLSASPEFQNAAPDSIYGPRATQEVRWHGHNATDLANNLRGLDLQIRSANGIPNPGIGENPASADTASCIVEGGVHMASVDLDAALTTLNIPHIWDDYGPGCHTAPNFEREITDTFAVFAKVFAHPPAPPATFDYESIQPTFDVYGWHVAADPARALEFLRMSNVSIGGLTLIGSGTTTVTTPALFHGVGEVGLIGARETTATPDATGRIRFTVDLGPPDADQQYTAGARTTETKRTVAFAPGPVVGVSPAPSASGACASRRLFMIHVRPPRGVSYVRVVVRVGSRRIRVARRGRSFVGRVDLRGLRRGRFSVGITAVTTAGSTIRSVRRYRTCTPGRRARSGSR